MIQPLIYEIIGQIEKQNADKTELEKTVKCNLTELQNKVNTLEEKHFVTGEIPQPIHEKLPMYKQEMESLTRNITDNTMSISN